MMDTHAYTRHLYNRPTIIIIVLIACLSQTSSCFHSSDDTSSPGVRVAFSILFDPPEFFAWKDGDGPWTEETVSGDSITVNVTDAQGRYTAAAFGNFRDLNIGYYIESTLGDAKTHSWSFDNTSTTTDYIINGEADNFFFGSFYVGTNFRFFQNQTSFIPAIMPPTPFTANFTQDADEPDSGDTLFVLNNISGIGHFKFGMRNYTDSSTLSYTAVPADAGTPFDVNHGAVDGSSGYSGLAYKFSGANLKALFVENFGMGSNPVQLEKFAAPAGKTFTISAGWDFAGSLFDTNIKYSQYFKDPPDPVTISQTPAREPTVTVGSDNNFTVRIDSSSLYSSGIPGLTNVMCGARVADSGFTTEWHLMKTMGRFDPMGGAQTFGFDAGLADLPTFPSSKAPVPAGIGRVSIYETNRTVQEELNFQYSRHAASEADDGMVRLRVNLNF